MVKKILDMVKKFFKERLGTIIFFSIVAIFLVWGSLSIKTAKENAITYSEDYEVPEKTADLLQEGEYVSIAKDDKLELLYNDVKGAIQVVDRKTGYVWKSIVDDDVYSLDGINKTWSANLQSAINIKYNDLKKRDSGVKQIYAAKDCGYLESEYIKNGVAVTYGFLKPGIYITVEYTIENGELVVRVPYEKIDERYKYAVTTINVLPFLGACGNENTGYLFYPDGCGAVTMFENVNIRPENVKMATYFTYTNKSVSFNNLFDSNEYDRYTAAMPVCGLKNGNNAFVAYATEGSENTAVTVYPSGITVDLNHIGFEVYTRNVYTVNMYNVSTEAGAVNTGGKVQRVDKKIIPEDKEIRFKFLSGDNANYSGMAHAYKEYLLNNNILKKAENVNNNALALRLLMGTTKEGMLFDEYIKMTTFEQSIDIVKELNSLGIGSIQLVLDSWQSDYRNGEYWGPESNLGGRSGLKKVSEFAEDKEDLNVYVEVISVEATSDTKKISEKKDIAYDGLNVGMAIEDIDGTSYYLLNPKTMIRRNDNLLKKLKKYKGIGIGYEDVGRYVYADFNEYNPYLKSEMVEEMKKLIETTSNTERNVAISGANAYTYSNADYLYDLREQSFGLSITDYAVPFVQMVVSGYIPYSSEDAGNLSYDLQTQKLKWIEYGSMPYFFLTAEPALNLRGTGRESLFSSTFEDWKEIVADTVKEFNDSFSVIEGKQMIDHKVLSSDLRQITYENGISIYINYSDSEQETDGFKIPAKGYVVTGGGR